MQVKMPLVCMAFGSVILSLIALFLAWVFHDVHGEPVQEVMERAQPPESVTAGSRAYGDCALGERYGPYAGENAQGHVWPQLQLARCRLLLPEDVRVTSREEFRRCLDDHIGWASLRYDLGDWYCHKTRIRVYAEAVCAPHLPQAADDHTP